MKQIALLLFVVLNTNLVLAKTKYNPEQACVQIQARYLKEAFHLTKNAVGFSAPVSARAYAYLCLVMYESGKILEKPSNDFTTKLNQYSSLENTVNPKLAPYVLVETNHSLYSYFYRSMPPSNAKRLKGIYDSLVKICSKPLSKNEVKTAVTLAKSISDHVINYSKTDGGDEAYLNNYPANYKEQPCLACWTRTSPGYFSALLPYWGSNRYFISSNKTVFDQMTPPVYSDNQESTLFKDSKYIDSITQANDPMYEIIGEYWDDSPGYSGTPSGHFFNIAQTVGSNKIESFMERAAFYLALGIALNDTFITCWYAKFHFNFLRPITYIHRFINPDFNSRIASPSFPEYPSGHSMQSGAGSEILNFFIGKQIAFTDSTNVWRKDIDGRPRSFNSFDQMATEISNSRVYGGIHYQNTADNSLNYGRLIGLNTLQILTQPKP